MKKAVQNHNQILQLFAACFRRVGVFSLLLTLTLLEGCAVGEPVPLDYYSGTEKIAGGEAPSVPIVTFTPATLRFDFTASIDPETGAEPPNYIVYFYTGIPVRYYETRFIEAILPAGSARSFFFTVGPGTYTIIVTGFDGYRESAVTDANRVTFTIP